MLFTRVINKVWITHLERYGFELGMNVEKLCLRAVLLGITVRKRAFINKL